jgi:hypothetical protein
MHVLRIAAAVALAWSAASVLAGFGYCAIKTAYVRRYDRAQAVRAGDAAWNKVAAAIRAADEDFDAEGVAGSPPGLPGTHRTDVPEECP